MVKITIEYPRKKNIVFWLDDTRWLDSIANMISARLFDNCVIVWAYNKESDALYSYRTS